MGGRGIRDVETIHADDPIEHATHRMLSAGRQLLPVARSGQLVGVVTAGDLATELWRAGSRGRVGSVVRTGIPVVAPDDPLDTAMRSLEHAGVAFVVDRDALVGLLTSEQLATFAAFRAARRLDHRYAGASRLAPSAAA